MKKSFKWVALGLCAVTLMASCKKKSSSEPVAPVTPGTPTTPTTPTTPVDNTKGIKLTLAAGQTTFSIAGLAGESISIEGLEASAKTIAGWNYRTKTENYTAPTAGAVITIRGNVKALTISAGSFASVDLSAAPTTIDTLRVVGPPVTSGSAGSGATVTALDLSGAKSLKMISLSSTGTKATVDLSNHTNLETMSLSSMSGFVATLPASIKTLYLSESPSLGNSAIDVATFPNLQRLFLIGTAIGSKSVNLSGSKTLTTFGNSRSKIKSLDLSNCTALVNVMMRDMNGGPAEINLSGSTNLKQAASPKLASLTSFDGFVTDLNTIAARTLNLANCAFTKFDADICQLVNLTTIDLSGNKLASADFSKFTALKTLNLLNNSTLTGTALTAALNTLPTVTGGTLKIAGLSASDQAIATGKGWAISAN